MGYGTAEGADDGPGDGTTDGGGVGERVGIGDGNFVGTALMVGVVVGWPNVSPPSTQKWSSNDPPMFLNDSPCSSENSKPISESASPPPNSSQKHPSTRHTQTSPSKPSSSVPLWIAVNEVMLCTLKLAPCQPSPPVSKSLNR